MAIAAGAKAQLGRCAGILFPIGLMLGLLLLPLLSAWPMRHRLSAA